MPRTNQSGASLCNMTHKMRLCYVTCIYGSRRHSHGTAVGVWELMFFHVTTSGREGVPLTAEPGSACLKTPAGAGGESWTSVLSLSREQGAGDRVSPGEP